MKYLLVAGLLVVAGQAQAQQVYKCVNGKDVSYQSRPCAGVQKQAKAWDATPEPPPTNDELWRRYHAKKKGERDSAYLRSLAAGSGGGSGAAIGGSQSDSACQAAKRSRQATLDAAGIDRTHDMLRRLDEMVYQACK